MRVQPNITKYWILHHDNAPAHAALSVAQFFYQMQYDDAAASLLNPHPATSFISKIKIGSERTPF